MGLKKISILLCSIFLLAGLLTPQIGHAQNLKEFTTVDSLQVGDRFDFSITFDNNREYDISFPDSADFGSAFEIRSRQQFKVSEYRDSVHYELQFFGTADTLIPKLPVTVAEEADTSIYYTQPVPVKFNSVLTENDDTLRPLKPIYEFARAWWPYLLGVLLLAIAGYYGYQYYVRWQKEQQEEKERPQFSPVPFENPLKVYRSSIKELENAELTTQEDYKLFYSQLGDAIRQYYESLYGLPALESTSGELLNMLRTRSVDQNLIDDTQAVLQEADMVKFAKFNPTQKQADRALTKAYDFLERAKQVDGSRIDHKRRKHQSEMERKRKEFERNQQNQKEVQE